MPFNNTTTFEVSTRGQISDDVVDRARERLGRVATHCREPVTHVELRLTDDDAHRGEVRAEATLTVKKGPVRAHAVATTAGEAVDAMIDRLRGRLDRHESKLHRIGTRRDDGTAAAGSWHHGDVDTAPRRPLPVLTETAEVVRRKSFANAPISVTDAVLDLEVLDHDFYLFRDAETHDVSLISRASDGTYELAADTSAPELAVGIRQVPGACVLSDDGAQRLLATTGEPFVFYRNGPEAQPQVLYRRYDGNLGTIELGGS